MREKCILPFSGAVELQKELSQQTGAELPATFVFDYPSVGEMCGFILGVLPPAMPDKSEPEPASHADRAQSSAESSMLNKAAAAEVDGVPMWMHMDQASRRQFMQQQVLPKPLKHATIEHRASSIDLHSLRSQPQDPLFVQQILVLENGILALLLLICILQSWYLGKRGWG